MFQRIRNALASRRGVPLQQQVLLQRWAHERGLGFQGRDDGGFSLEGAWGSSAFRAECSRSKRSYIKGFELKARYELSVTPELGLVLMNRTLKSTFEAQANALFEDVTNALETRARQLPEEVQWLSRYRDAGWPGPRAEFWSRYAVLTDAADIARNALDDALVGLLMEWPQGHSGDTPVLYLLDRGNAYLRLQMDSDINADVAQHALNTLGEFSQRLANLLGQR